jgi:XTP/dITP diphosphohydrolase
MHLHLAVGDPGQFAELEFAARAFPHVSLVPIEGLERVASSHEVDETFSGNAHRTALAFSRLMPGEIVVGADSGFFVGGRGGAPGTRSDEYADDEGFPAGGSREERNIACVLARAKKLRYRDASYVCSLAAVRDEELLAVGTGEVEGQLMDTPAGAAHHEFDRGYERILSILDLGRSMAELDGETRVRTSHYGRALVDLVKRLGYVVGR